jgi:hypothetical protein
MPDDDIQEMKTAEPDQHDVFKESKAPSGDSDAAEQAAGAFATSDGQTGPSGHGTSVAGAAQGAAASSADGTTDDGDHGKPATDPQPPTHGLRKLSGPAPAIG